MNGSMMNHGAGAGAGTGVTDAFPQNAGGWAQKKNFITDFGVKRRESRNPDSALLNSALSNSLVGGREGQESARNFTIPRIRKIAARGDGLAATLIGEKTVTEMNGAPFYQGTWKCRTCGHMNTGETHCKRCRSLRFAFRPAAEVSKRDDKTEQTWSHLKFIKPMDAAKPVVLTSSEVKDSIKTTSKFDQSREERLAQTKDGRYVAFRSSAAPAEVSPAEAFPAKAFPAEASPSPGGFKLRFGLGGDENVGRSQIPEKGIGRIKRIKSRRARGAPAFVTSTQDESNQLDKGSKRAKERKRSRVVSEHENEDDEDDWLGIEEKKERKKERAARKSAAPPTSIILPEYISVVNLAIALRVPLNRFGAKMHELGFEDTNHDHILDAETAGLIASEFNYEPNIVTPNESHDIRARPPVEDKSLLPPRPPVVTIMGHVDHGKTSLLDWLRKSSVAASEHGGITQHIGAFSVSMPSGRLITFLDTPGHAAFLDMRQRGANVTDIVILVVAADDSVKPQTLEALKHAQAAKVPIIVAVSKVDKEGLDLDRVKKDLARHGVEIEEYGGDTQVVPVSAKTGQGMVELEEAVIALADLLDFRAEKDGAAEGWVLEATKRKAGRAATVLVSRGTIRPGDVIVAGPTWTKARTLRDASGARLLTAGPGTPVEIDGWREQPKAGDQVLQAESEQQAKSAVDYRIEVAARDQMAADMAALNEARRAELQRREQKAEEKDEQPQEDKVQERGAGEESGSGSGSGSSELQAAKTQPGTKDVFFIIKADVSGSVEAVLNSVSALATSEVCPQIISSGVGPVTEFEIDHVATAGGHIISFNLDVEPSMIRRADQAGVEIISHNIIYRLIDDVKARLLEHLPPIVTLRVLGEAEIAQIFQFTVKARVQVPFAGCKVRNGVITRKGKVRVMRKGKEVYNGVLLFSLFCCSTLSEILSGKAKC